MSRLCCVTDLFNVHSKHLYFTILFYILHSMSVHANVRTWGFKIPCCDRVLRVGTSGSHVGSTVSGRTSRVPSNRIRSVSEASVARAARPVLAWRWPATVVAERRRASPAPRVTCSPRAAEPASRDGPRGDASSGEPARAARRPRGGSSGHLRPLRQRALQPRDRHLRRHLNHSRVLRPFRPVLERPLALAGATDGPAPVYF
jgi:hypothetical protein